MCVCVYSHPFRFPKELNKEEIDYVRACVRGLAFALCRYAFDYVILNEL